MERSKTWLSSGECVASRACSWLVYHSFEFDQVVGMNAPLVILVDGSTLFCRCRMFPYGVV